MTNNAKKIIAILLIVIFGIGFFIGRSISSVVTKIEYVKGDVIHNTITKDSLVYIKSIPLNPILPTIRDTQYIDSVRYVLLKVDTSKIISNYVIERKYNINVFDNNNGKLIIKPTVQYNEIQSIPYEFTPVTKEITKVIEHQITPFISVGYNSFGYIQAGGGVFYHNIGIEVDVVTDSKNKGFEISGKYKF